jgi:hypothetical protein
MCCGSMTNWLRQHACLPFAHVRVGRQTDAITEGDQASTLAKALDETEYTLQTLGKFVADLAAGHKRFFVHGVETGLIRSGANFAVL